MRIFGWLVVALSLIVVLLSAAPFTPAVFLVVLLLPAAAVLAWQGSAIAGLLSFASCVLAFVVSPLQVSQLLQWPTVVMWLVISSLAVFAGVINVALSGRKEHAL